MACHRWGLEGHRKVGRHGSGVSWCPRLPSWRRPRPSGAPWCCLAPGLAHARSRLAPGHPRLYVPLRDAAGRRAARLLVVRQLGEELWTARQLPVDDTLAFTGSRGAYVQPWLAQLILAGTHHLGGLEGALLLREHPAAADDAGRVPGVSGLRRERPGDGRRLLHRPAASGRRGGGAPSSGDPPVRAVPGGHDRLALAAQHARRVTPGHGRVGERPRLVSDGHRAGGAGARWGRRWRAACRRA